MSSSGRRLLLVLLVAISPVLEAAIPPSERDALVELYESTGGDEWSDRTGWLGTAGTECSWYGITCDETEEAVIDISLWSNNLVGTIPASVGNFPSLQGLALAGNALTGTIPSSIGNLSSLTTLNLQENRLTGPIPSSIGNLADLEEMHLFVNELSGSIPPSLGQLSSLMTLTLANNQITGEIPAELGNLSSIRYLDMGGLQLTGSIPPSLGQLTTLEWLSFESSQISGPIPPELGQLFNLEHLDLQYNALTGPIPPELSGMTSLEALYLGVNQLTGSIPDELMSLTTLLALTLDSNRLTGPIPASIANLSNLEYLSLGFNELSGEIPAGIGELGALMFLDIPGNGFSGPIPREIGLASSLTYVDLSGNQDDFTGQGGLSGPVPVELANLTSLQTLELSNNDLSGTIPPALGDLSNLEWLGLAENRMTGTIPDSFAKLENLQWLSLFGNRLEGSVPAWLGELTDLTGVFLGGNLLVGPIPANVTNLTRLESFDLCGNFISGPIPSDIGRLSELRYLTLCENDLSGPIPASFWSLSNLIEVRLGDNQLSGPLPSQIANLQNVDVLLLADNQLEGEIPPEIGELTTVTVMSLDGNRLSGAIPPEIGQLTQIQFLGLEKNALRGSIPTELANLVNLESQGLRLGYNALSTTDSTLRQFINEIHDGEPFQNTQTVAPTNVAVNDVTDRSSVVSWSPILYIYDAGGYEVTATPVGGGPSVVATTPSKDVTSIILRDLTAETSYEVVVRSTTHPHGFQQNFIRSEPSDSASFTTGPRVISPASVGIVSVPGGLIQIGGQPQNSTSYALANFGDVATDITIGQDGDFFTQTPSSFTLEPGESQIITVESVPNQPADSYWGTAFPSGDGVPEDLFVTIQLLSIDAPSGQAVAEAITSRVELSGSINEDSIGTVTFRNVGTAPLTGILISDVDWIETPTDLIQIGEGELLNVNFTVRRSKRPDANLGGTGTLFASIRLIYLDGTGIASISRLTPSNGTTGVSQTLVTIVDTSRPPVQASEIPPLEANEVMHVVPGVIAGGGIVSDVFITNSFGSTPLQDLRVYFKPLGGPSKVAEPESVAPSQSLAFASVVDTVFESESATGSLMIRTDQIESLLLSATRTDTGSSTNPFGGTIPIFRSDRGAGAGTSLSLPGVRIDGSHTTTLFIQEVTGEPATVTVDALDSSGTLLSQPILETAVERFGLLVQAQIPQNTVTLVVTAGESASGRIVAWALVEDTSTGDSWAVVDWQKFHQLEPSESLRVPFVLRDGEATGRERPIRRPGVSASLRVEPSQESGRVTSVTFFNPSTDPATVRGTFWSSGISFSRLLTVQPRETRVIDDIVSFIRGGTGRALGYVVIRPLSGDVATTARITGNGPNGSNLGTSVPLLPESAGMRLGQKRLFAGLDDSTMATVEARLGGTARTSFGIAEISGESVTVRAVLRGVGGGVVAGTMIFRDFIISPHSVALFDDMARTILGGQRDTLLGDLRNLQLELRAIGGDGAASVFVIATDNGSEDPTLRLD